MELNWSKVPFWVHLKGVPLELFTKKGIGYLTSVLGMPLYMDRFIAEKKRLEYARPIKCEECPMFGHTTSSCSSKKSKVVQVWKPKQMEKKGSKTVVNDLEPLQEVKDRGKQVCNTLSSGSMKDMMIGLGSQRNGSVSSGSVQVDQPKQKKEAAKKVYELLNTIKPKPKSGKGHQKVDHKEVDRLLREVPLQVLLLILHELPFLEC
ncbi:hypothetical protein PTKIN_Ptkin18bG0127400 [Pterospermum kingtungense]